MHNEESNAADNVNKTMQALPKEWAQDQWHVTLPIIGTTFVLFACIYR